MDQFVGRMLGNRYELIEKLGKAEWLMCIKPNVTY